MTNTNTVWHNVRIRAQAVSNEELEAARKLPADRIRAYAAEQIERAKQLFSEAAKVKWFEGPVAVYFHWKPWKDIIDNAESNFKNGEDETDPDRKKEYYVLAWRTGRVAVDRIAEEAKKDRTLFSIYLEPIVEKGKEIVKEAQQQIRSSSEVFIKIAVGLAFTYIAIKALDK